MRAKKSSIRIKIKYIIRTFNPQKKFFESTMVNKILIFIVDSILTKKC